MALDELEKAREAGLERAVEQVIAPMVRQGTDRVAALELLERHCTWLLAPSAKWHVRTDDGILTSGGTTDAHLDYFGRLLHLHYVHEVGGTPQALGTEQPPKAERDQRIAAEAERNAELARQRDLDDKARAAAVARQVAAGAAADSMRHADPRGAF